MENMNNLSFVNYIQREDFTHASYDPEQEFYTAIKIGDLNKVNELCEVPLHKKVGLGTLSSDNLQNMKYHFVITAALVARYCIEGGMETTVAFRISDFYISKVDKLRSVEKISSIHKEMCTDYCIRMRDIQKSKPYSRSITKAIDYIYDHLNKRITVKELSEYTGLSEGHLSRLFKQETDQNISDFIIDRKIDTAKNLLLNSDFNLASISFMLAFPSQSYFTEVFKKKTGMTPNKYRNEIRSQTPFGARDPES